MLATPTKYVERKGGENKAYGWETFYKGVGLCEHFRPLLPIQTPLPDGRVPWSMESLAGWHVFTSPLQRLKFRKGEVS
jgi:hypothetical protein